MSIFLFLAAALGGLLNAVAGGGSFITLPSLIWAGLAPVAANATSTLAMWPGSIASAVGYRRELGATRQRLLSLGGVSLLGGFVGAVLLIRTSDASFLRLLPWLMLLASATFTFGGMLPQSAHRQRMAAVLAVQFAISVYGGYFGGGMGIMMLATMTIAGMTDIHEMNGLKSMLAMAINGVALVEFASSGAIAWRPGIIMIAGAVAGGYIGAALARQVHPSWVRRLVIVIGWSMTIYFFVR